MNPGVWLNDEIVNFMIGLMLQDEEALRLQNPKQKSYFIFTSQFMAQLLNRGSNDMDGEYTYAKVKGYTNSQIFFLIYLSTTKFSSHQLSKPALVLCYNRYERENDPDI